MLDVREIHTYYGDSYVLQGLSFNVGAGQVVSLLGRNAVGKTTTIRSVIGLTPARQGQILFKGEDITHRPTYEIARMGIGLVPQGRRVFSSLTVQEHLDLDPAAKSGAWSLDRIHRLFPRLRERRTQRANTLSGGEQSMLSIARALRTNPDLLLMDEPTEGLAPLLVDQVAEAILELKTEKQSILLVEQNLSLALDLADFIYVLSKGRIVFSGSAQELRGNKEIQAKYLGF